MNTWQALTAALNELDQMNIKTLYVEPVTKKVVRPPVKELRMHVQKTRELIMKVMMAGSPGAEVSE